jgi:ATP-binding cassette subfamily B protein
MAHIRNYGHINPEDFLRSKIKTKRQALIKGTLSIWRGVLLPYKKTIIASAIVKIFANLTSNIILPIVIGLMITHLATSSQVNTKYINFTISLIVLLLITGIGLEYLWNKLSTRYFVRARKDLEIYTFNKLLSKSYRFYAGSFGGSITSQFNKFINAFGDFHQTVVKDLFNIAINFIASLFATFFYSKIIGITMLIWTLVYVFVIWRISLNRFENKRAGTKNNSKMTGFLSDVLGNITTIKIFSREKHETGNYRRLAVNKMNNAEKAIGWANLTLVFIGLMMAVLNVSVLMISTYQITNQQITIGTLVLIQAFVVRLSIQLWQLGTIIRDLDRSFVESSEMSEILLNEPDLVDPEKTKKSKITKGAIEFKNVTFEYPDEHSIPKFFDNLSFKINPGEKVGIVGPSGSGKTTIIRILLRLTEINSGSIKLDGQNIKNLKHSEIRKAISYVPQEPILFHRSLIENIRYSNPSATQSMVDKAVKKSRANIFIDRLPKGYETLVGERGFKLSTGQRQRIAIARAILKPSPILILDEATSAIDSESESIIQKAMSDLMESRTTLVIAHRLSTVEKMDRIIYMSYGKIIEEGSHKELLAKHGPYANLWKHQSGKNSKI